jgi:hypothetical protein
MIVLIISHAGIVVVQVRARKYVVLSSGTLGTPQILERSGVGDAKLLKNLDIKVVSDLPGVGCVSYFTLAHLQSHLMSCLESNIRITTRPCPVGIILLTYFPP